MDHFRKKCLIILTLGLFLVLAGCTSSPDTNVSFQVTSAIKEPITGETIVGYSPDHSKWIRVDPILDVYQGSAQNGTIISLNFSGTTNYPSGSIIWIDGSVNRTRYPGATHSWSIHNETTTVQENGGENTFVYRFRIREYDYLHFGQYIVTARKANSNVTASAFFNVLLNKSEPRAWIDVDPIPNHNIGDIFTITGTTNLPPGSMISINVQNFRQTCPGPDYNPANYTGLSCGGDCQSSFSYKSIPVLSGREDNIWLVTLNTTPDWCIKEKYDVWGQFGNWKNLTSEEEEFAFNH
jgi:hypothetical protein